MKSHLFEEVPPFVQQTAFPDERPSQHNDESDPPIEN